MNTLMSFAFLIALLASGYFLVRFIIAAVRKQPTDSFKKKLIASVIATVVTLVGFNVTRSPEQIATHNEKVEAERKATEEKKLADEKAAEEKKLADEKAAEEKRLAEQKAAEEKKLADEKAAEEKRLAEQKAAEEKKLADAKAAEERKAAEAQRKQNEITKEIATGWNLETTDTSNDGTNLLKASGLLKKYPDYIHSAAANWINVTDALKKPWDFYGKVVNLSGRIYSIEQLPPGSSAAKFFGKDCYEAMLAVGDDYDPIAIAMIIVGDSSHVSENSTVNVKGFIYGHSQLVNNMGGTNIRGLAFVGFQE